ncbi:MAG: DUF4238 domain-containing protein [Rhodobacteraceae bacterium]|nr:DUF4238 domain-containing protein [Paracoccaceae bacterium]
MTNNTSHDHHFVPVFYLKRWIVAPEKRLVEYRRRGDGIIRPRWTGPRGTGYEHSLYDAADGSVVSLEESFMKPADTHAASAMKVFLSQEEGLHWTQAQRSSWSRFIMSMLMRHPDDIAELKQLVEQDWTNLTDEMREAYSHGWQDGMPESAEEWWEQNRDVYIERARLQWLRGLIDNEGIGRTINSMSWNVANVAEARHGLLTSDKPICMTNGIGTLDAFIIMPLTPTKLFIAVRHMDTLELILRMPMNELVDHVNREVVLNARRFVFAANTSLSRFVSDHFGRSDQPSWMMRLAQKRARDREQGRSL